MGTILLWQCYDDLRKRKVLTWLRNTTKSRHTAHDSKGCHYFCIISTVLITSSLHKTFLGVRCLQNSTGQSDIPLYEEPTRDWTAKQKSGILSQQFSFSICRLKMSTPKSYKYVPPPLRLKDYIHRKRVKVMCWVALLGLLPMGLKSLKIKQLMKWQKLQFF